MKKRILCLLLMVGMLLMLLPAFTIAAPPYEELSTTPFNVELNGQLFPINVDAPPRLYPDGQVLAPMRAVSEMLGFSVNWDNPTQTITMVRSDYTIIMTVGDDFCTTNGTAYPLGAVVEIFDARVFIPCSFAESMGCKVNWDSMREVLVISSPQPIFLPIPQNVRWSMTDRGMILFDLDPLAPGRDAISRYEYIIFLDGSRISNFNNTNQGQSGTIGASCNPDIRETGTYTVYVRAVSASQNFLDSPWIASNDYNYTRPTNELAPPANPHWDPNNMLTAVWDAVPGASSYLIRIYVRDGGETRSFGAANIQGTSYNTLQSIDQSYITGSASYQFYVIATSNDIENLAASWDSKKSNSTGNNNNILNHVNKDIGDIDSAGSADDIKDALGEINQTDLEFAIKTGNTEVLAALAALENAVSTDMGITATVTPDPSLEGLLGDDLSQIKVLGAAFNSTGNDIDLSFTAPTGTLPDIGGNYQTGSLFVDIKLTEGLTVHGDLAFPIQITMPIPPGFTNAMRILHYNSDGSIGIIYPRINGDGTMSFTLTSFSLFAFVQPKPSYVEEETGLPGGGSAPAGGGAAPAVSADSVKEAKSASGKATVNVQDTALAELGATGKIVVSITEKATAAALLDQLAAIDAVNRQLAGTIYTVSTTSDGQKTGDAYQQYQLSVDVSGITLTDAQKAILSGIFFDPVSGTYNNLGGELSADGKTFTFYSSYAGDHTLIVSDSLLKLTFTIGSSDFVLNGQSKPNDVAPVVTDGRTLLPVRAAAEALGADVLWDDETRTVTLTKGGKSVSVVVDQPLPDGMGTAVIMQDRTFVPIRYFAQMLDCNILWDEATRSIKIYS